jgi:hypothetical protein
MRFIFTLHTHHAMSFCQPERWWADGSTVNLGSKSRVITWQTDRSPAFVGKERFKLSLEGFKPGKMQQPAAQYAADIFQSRFVEYAQKMTTCFPARGHDRRVSRTGANNWGYDDGELVVRGQFPSGSPQYSSKPRHKSLLSAIRRQDAAVYRLGTTTAFLRVNALPRTLMQHDLGTGSRNKRLKRTNSAASGSYEHPTRNSPNGKLV